MGSGALVAGMVLWAAVIAGTELLARRNPYPGPAEAAAQLGHAFVPLAWARGCGWLAHPQADRCGQPEQCHPEAAPVWDAAALAGAAVLAWAARTAEAPGPGEG